MGMLRVHVWKTFSATLARFFSGLHWAVGITALPATATPSEERSFVLMWLGIIVFVVVFFAGFIYFIAGT